MYFVYLLKSKKSCDLYTGCTGDLRKRFTEHNNNRVSSTKDKGPYELVYYEAYKSEKDAFKREKNLKLRANALTGLKRRLIKSLD